MVYLNLKLCYTWNNFVTLIIYMYMSHSSIGNFTTKRHAPKYIFEFVGVMVQAVLVLLLPNAISAVNYAAAAAAATI